MTHFRDDPFLIMIAEYINRRVGRGIMIFVMLDQLAEKARLGFRFEQLPKEH